MNGIHNGEWSIRLYRKNGTWKTFVQNGICYYDVCLAAEQYFAIMKYVDDSGEHYYDDWEVIPPGPVLTEKKPPRRVLGSFLFSGIMLIGCSCHEFLDRRREGLVMR